LYVGQMSVGQMFFDQKMWDYLNRPEWKMPRRDFVLDFGTANDEDGSGRTSLDR
jgi:hypothetical protein